MSEEHAQFANAPVAREVALALDEDAIRHLGVKGDQVFFCRDVLRIHREVAIPEAVAQFAEVELEGVCRVGQDLDELLELVLAVCIGRRHDADFEPKFGSWMPRIAA